jgi:tripartite-type tricarboxylate transporter receptor subunit TctC
MTRLAYVVAPIVLLAAGIACAQEFPSRPVRLLVPSAPGGSSDINARELANELTKQVGQQVVVENRPDASGGLGQGGTPEDFAEHVRKETARLGKLIKAVGIKPQ